MDSHPEAASFSLVQSMATGKTEIEALRGEKKYKIMDFSILFTFLLFLCFNNNIYAIFLWVNEVKNERKITPKKREDFFAYIVRILMVYVGSGKRGKCRKEKYLFLSLSSLKLLSQVRSMNVEKGADVPKRSTLNNDDKYNFHFHIIFKKFREHFIFLCRHVFRFFCWIIKLSRVIKNFSLTTI